MNKKITLKSLLIEKDRDAYLYICGLLTGVIVFLFEIIINLIHLPQICVIHSLTGLYCPGCGGTRAFEYLIHGNLLKSLQYHPLVLYGAILALFFYTSQTLRFVTHGKVKGIHFHTVYIIIGVAIIIINWLVKNIALIVFSTDMLN